MIEIESLSATTIGDGKDVAINCLLPKAGLFGQGLNFSHIENSALSALAIEYTLKITGLFWRGRGNAAQVECDATL